jgi:hypothetical protein
MSDSSAALGRLVAHENSASDLLAFLFERDPNPLTTLPSLDVGVYRCRRDGRTPAGSSNVFATASAASGRAAEYLTVGSERFW